MGSSSQSDGSSVMTVYVHSSPFCPVDHSKDPEIIQTFYKLVKTYTLPKLPNVTLKTVHRWKYFRSKIHYIQKDLDCYLPPHIFRPSDGPGTYYLIGFVRLNF